MLIVRCPACGQTREVVALPMDRYTAVGVIDHRRKFSDSSILAMWRAKFGDLTPEQVFPDLEGIDVDAYFAALNAAKRA